MASKRPAPPAPDKYEVESAAHTIKRAHEHMANKRLMRHVKKHVRGEAKNMAAFAKALQGGGMASPSGGMPGQPDEQAQASSSMGAFNP
jgi:hypothetical protein